LQARPSRASAPQPDDLPGWDELFQLQEAAVAPANVQVLERYAPALGEAQLAGMPAVVVRPSTVSGAPARIVYLHGGAYTLFSARSTLFATVPLAHDLGLELWSLDYPRAPRTRHDQTVPWVTEALRAACADGAPVLLVGDSAGGGLAVAATLRLQRGGWPRPTAVCLWSPWTDLAAPAASRALLADVDPILRAEPDLARAALAYAPVARLRDPDVSPAYGEFSCGFPPTLIQCGTREILLSDAVRLHHAIVAAGGRVRLDILPGLVHSYPAVLPQLPESRRARRRMLRFFELLRSENRVRSA
jgi:acetyl esterase/lipase